MAQPHKVVVTRSAEISCKLTLVCVVLTLRNGTATSAGEPYTFSSEPDTRIAVPVHTLVEIEFSAVKTRRSLRLLGADVPAHGVPHMPCESRATTCPQIFS